MTSESSKPPVVALYLRVSTSQQDFEIQLDGLREEAQKMGAKIFNEYTDKGYGGDTQVSERAYADDVIRDASLGKFQTLLIWKIDRVARDEEFGLNYLRRIEETGCKVKFLMDAGINTPDEYTDQAASLVKTMRVSYLTGARMYLESVRTNVRASKKNWIKANKWPSSQIPDGYKLNVSYGLDRDDTRAKYIERIFDLYVDDKLTVRQIVDLLNKEGIPSATARQPDKKWVKDSVQDKLSNQVYIGKLPIYWKDKINKTASVIHTFTCAPIISDGKFAEAQEIKKERMKRSRGNPKPGREYPFRPYLWCARCGYELHTLTSNANKPNESHHYGFRKPSPGYGTYKRRCPQGCGRISEPKLINGIYQHVGRFFTDYRRDKFMKSGSEKDAIARGEAINQSAEITGKVLEFLEGDSDAAEIRRKRRIELAELEKELQSFDARREKVKDMYESEIITDKREVEARLAKINNNPRIKIIQERIRFIKQTMVAEDEDKRRMGSLVTWADAIKKITTERTSTSNTRKWLFDDIHANAPLEHQKAVVLKLLKFIKKIHVDFPERKLTIETRIPKYLDGKVVFETDPVIAKGRPRKGSNKNGGNNGGNNSSRQVTSVNSSNQSLEVVIQIKY